MKTSRRKAREDATQILYQLQMNPDGLLDKGLKQFARFFSKDQPVDPFTERLVRGVVEHLAEIDGIVEKSSEHWRSDRMAMVDRNILRLGIFELHYCDDIPVEVTLNEMIEIAKHFGSENSAAFINGILNHVKEQLDRPNKAR